jgi:tetratricopeptide (TPR) repeat protein
MRPLHLVGLRGVNGETLRFNTTERAPLVLPALIPLIDQEQILAFYQEVVVPGMRLPRIEVDWVRSLLPKDRRFLRNLRERHGAERSLIVVKVRRPFIDQHVVDLIDILSQPELEVFEYVAVSAVDQLQNESLRRLSQLAQFVTEVAQDRYQEIAQEMGQLPEGFTFIQERVKVLLNPVDILEAVNVLIDTQDERNSIENAISATRDINVYAAAFAREPARSIEERVVWRLLSKMFEARPIEEQILLIAIAFGRTDEVKPLLQHRYEVSWNRLRAAQLIRNNDLAGWARWLTESKYVELSDNLVNRAWSRHSEAHQWLDLAREWLPGAAIRQADNTLRERVMSLFGLINGGQFARAEEEVQALQPLLNAPEVSKELRGDFLDAVGRLWLAVDKPNEGLDSLRTAVALLNEADASPISRSATLHHLACGLRDNGHWSEAEPLFRESIRLAEMGADSLANISATLDAMARGLRDNGRWPEAESTFREALRLQEVGGASSLDRSYTMYWLADGLSTNGRWSEAETYFRESLRLGKEGDDSAESQGITLTSLARGLRDNNHWGEAEPLFREALRLEDAGGASAGSRSITLYEWARGLINNGRWQEAEPLFREALRLGKEGGASVMLRNNMTYLLACQLKDNGRWQDAEPLFREAVHLGEESGESFEGRSITLIELARGLSKDGRWLEAEPLYREALELKQKGNAPSGMIAAILREFAAGLREQGDLNEADAAMNEANRLVSESST